MIGHSSSVLPPLSSHDTLIPAKKNQARPSKYYYLLSSGRLKLLSMKLRNLQLRKS
jgi:hypothetical protein